MSRVWKDERGHQRITKKRFLIACGEGKNGDASFFNQVNDKSRFTKKIFFFETAEKSEPLTDLKPPYIVEAVGLAV